MNTSKNKSELLFIEEKERKFGEGDGCGRRM